MKRLLQSSIALVAVVPALVPAHASAQSTTTSSGRQLLLSIPPMIAAIATTGPETRTFGYETKGQLVSVVRDGSAGDVTTTSASNRAGNLKRLTTTGLAQRAPALT